MVLRRLLHMLAHAARAPSRAGRNNLHTDDAARRARWEAAVTRRSWRISARIGLARVAMLAMTRTLRRSRGRTPAPPRGNPQARQAGVLGVADQTRDP
jgi:hypothetical protein